MFENSKNMILAKNQNVQTNFKWLEIYGRINSNWAFLSGIQKIGMF